MIDKIISITNFVINIVKFFFFIDKTVKEKRITRQNHRKDKAK